MTVTYHPFPPLRPAPDGAGRAALLAAGARFRTPLKAGRCTVCEDVSRGGGGGGCGEIAVCTAVGQQRTSLGVSSQTYLTKTLLIFQEQQHATLLANPKTLDADGDSVVTVQLTAWQ